MIKTLLYCNLLILLLGACSTVTLVQETEFPAELSTAPPVLSSVATKVIGTSPATSAVFPASPTSIPTTSPTATPSIAMKPVIHDQPGDNYEVMFSIPIDSNSIIQYERHPDSIQGPNAIAVMPDGSFLIADPVGARLLHFGYKGHLLNTTELGYLGIGYINDLRLKGDILFLLETSYQKYLVHRLTLTGALINREEIPYQFPIDANENTLENALTGMAVDCDGRIILEVTGGSLLFPLSDVQKQPDSPQITQGLLCNGKRYYVSISEPWTDPQVSAGEILYQTHLTYGFGGLRFLDVFQDGAIYLIRSDVVTESIIMVDQTIHYVGTDGAVQGIARIPLAEYYYPVMRSAAINPEGEVFVMIPRSDSLDIVRLNFYQELEPLIPDAEIPQVIITQ